MQQLATKIVDKPWGKRGLDPRFHVDPDRQVGEIWFEPPADHPLDVMVKYLFTTERLSVQVHPEDATARARGYPRGKDECWIVLDVADDAELGIGTVRDLTSAEVISAARDGSIVDLIDWRRPKKGDFIYNPAGTIHALGPGLTVMEIQQAVDLTYRLYDYGRPRELHLDEGVAVSDPVPYVAPFVPLEAEKGRLILADGPAFVLEHWARSGNGWLKGDGRKLWLVPVKGAGTIDGKPLQPGSAWLVEDGADLLLAEGTELLVAYPGRGLIREIWR